MENTPTTKETCEDRIDEQLESRSRYIGALVRVANEEGNAEDVTLAFDGEYTSPEEGVYLNPNDSPVSIQEMSELAWERLRELPLAVSLKRILRVDLSTGGPADFFEVEITEKGELAGTPTYHFQDWFDGAERTIQDDDLDTFLADLADTISFE